MECVRDGLVLLEQGGDGHVGGDCGGVGLRAAVLLLDQAGLVMVLWLGQGGLVQKVNECLLRFLVTLAIFACKLAGLPWLLLLLIQVDRLWLHFKKSRMLLFRLSFAIVLLFLLMISSFIMECYRAFWDVSRCALLRAWFGRFSAFLLFGVQV